MRFDLSVWKLRALISVESTGILLFAAACRRGSMGHYNGKWPVSLFFCLETADNCNNSYWSFSPFNLTGDYEKKTKRA